MRYYLTVQLKSDTTFGRGEGVAGLVDVEVDHDEHGCPRIGGRALKGLLVEEWANLRFALAGAGPGASSGWDDIAAALFGRSGAGDEGGGRLHIGAATLPPDLHAAIAADDALNPAQALDALTTIRRQTSVNAATGAPERGSLRAARAVVRGVELVAPLDLRLSPEERPRAEALLAACALAVRRGGLTRNRGRGRLSMLLHQTIPDDYGDAAFTRACFVRFAGEVRP
ncbi:MAG TPA: hypothetical protein PKD53_17330 [Chloroflexaceae bacterium]|nr:hypothetical protein [Chloroflexaceae bacterium]